MGCDGGTIPTRGELVKTKKKPEQLSKETELSIKWQHCAISQEPLRPPVVACRVGQLYNKEAVLEFLLTRSKSAGDSKLDHIRGLKDVKELRLTSNPAFREDSDTKAGAGSTGERSNVARFICPLTGLEMNGRFRFSYVKSCGCTFSERALQEVKDAGGGGGCLQCGLAFTRDEIIPINGDAEELERLRAILMAEKDAAKVSKKNKRAQAGGNNECASIDGKMDDSVNKKRRQDSSGSTTNGNTNNTSASSSDQTASKDDAAKSSTNGETNGNIGERNLETNGNSRGKQKEGGKTGDKGKQLIKNGKGSSDMGNTKAKSIQEDTKATEAYKSLFNTHPTALKQGKAHWVTYNPQYN